MGPPQARRAEFRSDASAAYGLYMSLYSHSSNVEHLTSAARVKLQLMHDPHMAAALLAECDGRRMYLESTGRYDLVETIDALSQQATVTHRHIPSHGRYTPLHTVTYRYTPSQVRWLGYSKAVTHRYIPLHTVTHR